MGPHNEHEEKFDEDEEPRREITLRLHQSYQLIYASKLEQSEKAHIARILHVIVWEGQHEVFEGNTCKQVQDEPAVDVVVHDFGSIEAEHGWARDCQFRAQEDVNHVDEDGQDVDRVEHPIEIEAQSDGERHHEGVIENGQDE